MLKVGTQDLKDLNISASIVSIFSFRLPINNYTYVSFSEKHVRAALVSPQNSRTVLMIFYFKVKEHIFNKTSWENLFKNKYKDL